MIELQPFTRADIPSLVGWNSTPEFLRQWAGDTFTHPLDAAQVEEHLKQTAAAGDLVFKAVERESGQAVGHIELRSIEREHRKARIARVLVGAENRGRGIGTQMMEAVLRIGFEQLGLHRMELGVYDFNTAAIACYEKVGFKKEGLLRDVTRMGEGYWSLWTMSILEDEWRARNPR